MFSIIIPVFNKAKYICFSIESVLNQSFGQFELIIVNDGSSDNINEILKENFSDRRIIVLNQDNHGVSSARNLGIAIAKFEYVAFLDADDFWEPNYLEEFYKTIVSFKNNSPSIIGCTYEVVNKQKILGIENCEFEKPYLIKNYFEGAHHNAIFFSSSTVVKTQVLRDLAGFNINLTHGEDLDMWFRIMMLDPIAIFIPMRLSYYFMGDPNQAMSYLPKLEKHIVGNIFSMYSKNEYFDKNPFFPIFIEKFLLKNLRPYYVLDKNKFEVKRLLADISNWHFPYIIFYLLPRTVVKIIYKLKKKIS